MNFLQDMVEGCFSSLAKCFEPLYKLIISIILVIFLPYRVSMIVGDAQTQLNIIAHVLALPLPIPIVCGAVIVLIIYFAKKR